MIQRIVANRYARALFNAAVEGNLVDRYEADFPVLLGAMSEGSDLKNYIEHPAIGAADKKQTLRSLFEKNLDPSFLNFILLLIDKKRIKWLRLIDEDFAEMLLVHRGLVRAEVRTPFALPEALKQQLIQKLGAVTGKTILLEEKITPELVGGVSVRMGDSVLDGSVRSGLDRLKSTLMNVKVR